MMYNRKCKATLRKAYRLLKQKMFIAKIVRENITGIKEEDK